MRLLLASILFVGCASDMPDKNKLYKKNMELEINGKRGTGVMVMDRADLYYLKSKFKASIEKLKINTCHRYTVLNNVGKSFKYTYRKIGGIENVGVCVMDIGAFDKTAENEWALIEFKNDDDMTHSASMACNGILTRAVGVSICQSLVGLRQSMEFGEETKVYAQDECKKPFTYDDKKFFYNIERGNCVFIFQGKTGFHRHRTYGYDDEL